MLALPKSTFLGVIPVIHTFLEKLLVKTAHGYSTNFDAQESIQQFYWIVFHVVLKVDTKLDKKYWSLCFFLSICLPFLLCSFPSFFFCNYWNFPHWFFSIATDFCQSLFLFWSLNDQWFCFGCTAIGAVIMGSVDGNRIWGKDIKAVQLAKVEVS